MQEKNSILYASTLHAYESQGYVILPGVFAVDIIRDLKHFIARSLEEFARELNTTYAHYTYCTGRWSYPSPVYNSDIFRYIDKRSKEMLDNFFGKSTLIKKQNVICKNEYTNDRVPLHQDISYSHKDPYHVSSWLALDDVEVDSGELVLIPGSHKNKIEPAVDFWSPFFTDNKWVQHQKELIRIYMKAGDVLLFNSRTWHGSEENLKKNDRYAYVTRWIVEKQELPSSIPEPNTMPYGMWSCHEQTIEAMARLRSNVIRDNHETRMAKFQDEILQEPLEKMIDYCIKELQIGYLLSNLVPDQYKASKTLSDLKVLHLSTSLHNAGDLCGNVYKNLWFAFLQYI